MQTPGAPCASGYPLICHRHFSAILEASIYPTCPCSMITEHGQEPRSGVFLLTTRQDRICSDSGLRIGMDCLQGKSGHEALESSCCSWDLIPRCTVEVACSLSTGNIQRQQGSSCASHLFLVYIQPVLIFCCYYERIPETLFPFCSDDSQLRTKLEIFMSRLAAGCHRRRANMTALNHLNHTGACNKEVAERS